MNEFIYVGTLINKEGKRREVNLKMGKLHWIDADGWRWRYHDGSNSSPGRESDANPTHLILDSVRRSPDVHNLANDLQMTHEGRIKGWRGKGKLYELRELTNHWCDKFGNKYRKENGWEVREQKSRLVLDSIMPLERVHHIKVRPKRPKG